MPPKKAKRRTIPQVMSDALPNVTPSSNASPNSEDVTVDTTLKRPKHRPRGVAYKKKQRELRIVKRVQAKKLARSRPKSPASASEMHEQKFAHAAFGSHKEERTQRTDETEGRKQLRQHDQQQRQPISETVTQSRLQLRNDLCKLRAQHYSATTTAPEPTAVRPSVAPIAQSVDEVIAMWKDGRQQEKTLSPPQIAPPPVPKEVFQLTDAYKQHLMNTAWQMFEIGVGKQHTGNGGNTIINVPNINVNLMFLLLTVNEKVAAAVSDRITGVANCSETEQAQLMKALTDWDRRVARVDVYSNVCDTKHWTYTRARAFVTSAMNATAYTQGAINVLQSCVVEPILMPISHEVEVATQKFDQRLREWLSARIRVNISHHRMLDVQYNRSIKEVVIVNASCVRILMPQYLVTRLVNIRWLWPMAHEEMSRPEERRERKMERKPIVGVRLECPLHDDSEAMVDQNKFTAPSSMLMYSYDEHFNCITLPCEHSERFGLCLIVAKTAAKSPQRTILPQICRHDLLAACVTGRYPTDTTTLAALTMPLVAVADARSIDAAELMMPALADVGALYDPADHNDISNTASEDGESSTTTQKGSKSAADDLQMRETSRGIVNNKQCELTGVQHCAMVKLDWLTNLALLDDGGSGSTSLSRSRMSVAHRSKSRHHKSSPNSKRKKKKKKRKKPEKARKLYNSSKAKNAAVGEVIIVQPFTLVVVDRETTLPILLAHIAKPESPRWAPHTMDRATNATPDRASSSLSSHTGSRSTMRVAKTPRQQEEHVATVVSPSPPSEAGNKPKEESQESERSKCDIM